MNKKIAVLGAGAIGSSVSADLTKAGYDITVIDQWPAQVEKIRTDGLEVTMPDGVVKTKINALHLCDLSSAKLMFDIVFMCVKSNDHRWLADELRCVCDAENCGREQRNNTLDLDPRSVQYAC